MTAESTNDQSQPVAMTLDELFRDLAWTASIGCAAPVVVVTVVSRAGSEPLHIHVGPDFATARSTAGQQPEVEADAAPRLADGTRLVFHATEPLVTRDGQRVGTLSVYDVVPRRLSVAHRQLLQRLARMGADVFSAVDDRGPLRSLVPVPTPPPGAELPPAGRGAPLPVPAIFDALREAVIHLDAQYNVLWANGAGRAALGLPAEPTGGAHLWEHLPEAVGGPFHAACLRALRTGRQELVADWFPIRNRQAETRIQPTEDGFFLVVRDVSEQRAAEASLEASREQLRALTQHLRSAQEDERRRISRELHDVVGQDLSVIKLRLEMLKKRLMKVKRNADNVVLCEDIIRDTENALAAARRLATDMRPSILDQLGLSAAVQWQAAELQRRTGIECHVHSEPVDGRQPAGRATAAFRVLQELLTNVLRHSEARHVDINLTEERGSLCLEVKDDGRGFTPETNASQSALGLLGVRERVGAHGGNVEIESHVGQGTRVRVTLPPPPTEPVE